MEGSKHLNLFFANHQLYGFGLALRLSRHNLLHMYEGDNNSNNIWD